MGEAAGLAGADGVEAVLVRPPETAGMASRAGEGTSTCEEGRGGEDYGAP